MKQVAVGAIVFLAQCGLRDAHILDHTLTVTKNCECDAVCGPIAASHALADQKASASPTAPTLPLAWRCPLVIDCRCQLWKFIAPDIILLLHDHGDKVQTTNVVAS
jgi:hypothetical protein